MPVGAGTPIGILNRLTQIIFHRHFALRINTLFYIDNLFFIIFLILEIYIFL